MRAWRLALTFLPALAFLAIWQAWVSGSPRREFLFASPLAVARAAIADLRDGTVFADILATGMTASAGLLGGAALGTIAGFTLWIRPTLASAARPYIRGVAALPIFALAPMLIIWFGIGFMPRAVMAGFPVVLATLVTSYELAGERHILHDEWMTGLGMSRAQRLKLVLVPEVFLGMLRNLQNNVGLAMVGTFIGEFVVSQRGLGRYILRSGSLYDVPRVLFGLALIALLSLLISATLGIPLRLQRTARRIDQRETEL